jgi:IrrE N-terminal-like domain
MTLTAEQKEILTKFTSEAPVKLAALADALGLEVFKSPLKPDISGLIEPSDTSRSGFRIRINRHEIPERQRFTLAHEIAHYILHRDKIGGGVVDNVMYRSNLSSRLEVEANKLAADIIMPTSLINYHLTKFPENYSEETVIGLANIFRVSQPAMRIRLGV